MQVSAFETWPKRSAGRIFFRSEVQLGTWSLDVSPELSVQNFSHLLLQLGHVACMPRSEVLVGRFSVPLSWLSHRVLVTAVIRKPDAGN